MTEQKYLQRFLYLETVAGVPGMVAGRWSTRGGGDGGSEVGVPAWEERALKGLPDHLQGCCATCAPSAA